MNLFDTMHWAIRDKFLTDQTGDPGSSSPKGRRYVDEKRIVRNPNGDPIHGGTTASIIALVVKDNERFIITANVGDSTALLLNNSGSESKWEFLTVDHGPENTEEWQRVKSLDTEQYPKKLLFVYDKTTVFRKYECPSVFLDSGKKRSKIYR